MERIFYRNNIKNQQQQFHLWLTCMSKLQKVEMFILWAVTEVKASWKCQVSHKVEMKTNQHLTSALYPQVHLLLIPWCLLWSHLIDLNYYVFDWQFDKLWSNRGWYSKVQRETSFQHAFLIFPKLAVYIK